MTFEQRLAASKPYITGFVLGLIAAPIIGFGAGWVSTSGARASAVSRQTRQLCMRTRGLPVALGKLSRSRPSMTSATNGMPSTR